ncbi:hypothetical protein CI1B_72940 [Bradyrhizobium ivorense]|uniref:Uncharacterized protein n=1 Tax=Bradyrhizobium ivorense TaxID=2511166 RepID=A0A508TVE5_9BRAD|nr:hypothetical protein CI1B_72940 [Bradyrhizobium ivorense]
MRPTTAYANLHALQSSSQYERRFEHPRDVLLEPSLAKKRAILASRASDDTAAIRSTPLRTLLPRRRIA